MQEWSIITVKSIKARVYKYIYIYILLHYLFARAQTRLVSFRGIPTRIHDVTLKHGNFLKFSDSRSLFKDSYGKRMYYTSSIQYDLKILVEKGQPFENE